MIAAYPDCQDIRCDDEDKAPAPVLKTTYATTQAPVIMDPEAQKYMTDLQARKKHAQTIYPFPFI